MDKKLVGLMAIFFLSFGVFTSILVFRKPLLNLARAKEDQVPSASSSKVILSCAGTMVKADGSDSCTVNVFIRTAGDSPKPLANKVVTLTTDLGDLDRPTQTTDSLGKAVFRITSSTPGIATLRAKVTQDSTDIELSSSISIEFK